MPASVLCPACKSPLPPSSLNTPDLTPCPTCGEFLCAVTFPALLKPAEEGKKGDVILQEGDASCFYHPGKQAITTCTNCGRFLCALCDIDMAGEHLCTRCIEAGKKKGRLKKLENRRMLYDDIALSLTVVSPMFCAFFIGGPMALYLVIRYWNKPGSILPRTKARFVLAAIFAFIEIGISIWLAFMWATRGFD